MKKIILLIFVQTLFKWAFSQVPDTIHIQVDSTDFPITYQLKKGVVMLEPEKLDQVVWIISSLNTSITDYKALVAAYETKDSLQALTETALRSIITAQETHLESKQETIQQLDQLAETCTSTVNLMLQEKEKQRKRTAFNTFAGITGGVLVGFGIGFLVCL